MGTAPYGNLGSLDLSTAGAIGLGGGLAGLGGLAGAFPTSARGTMTGATSGVQTGSSASSTSSQLQNLLNSIANITGTQAGTGRTTTAPNLTPQMQAYLTNLVSKAGTLTAPSLQGYTGQQIQNINQNADTQKQAVNNIMAARGLATSPAAATAQAGVEQNRINQVTGVQEQVPVLQNQLELQNMAQAAQIANILPSLTGTTQATEQQQTQAQQQQAQQQQQQYAQSWQNLFSFLQQFGNQNQTWNQNQGGGLGGAIGGAAQGLAAILPFILASDKRLKKDIKSISQDKAIEKIRELNSKTWKWRGGDRSDSGLIAQEVEQVLPDAVDIVNVNGKDIKAINYAAVIPYLVGAIQNLDTRVSVGV